VAQLSEWLQIMLAEIERKQEEGQRALEEQQRRLATSTPALALAPTPAPVTASAPERIAAL
jgi:hypothetical protein